MPDGTQTLTLETAASIHDVGAAAWNAAAGPEDPFVSFAFLSALEDSGSVAPRRGWLPHHLVAREDDGRVAGCVPLYLKSHSYGEYVFDWAWADAYERAGGRYYPKLQAAVPFTPVTGRRLLVRPDAPAGTADVLADGLVRLAANLGVSSVHVTFPTEAEWHRFQAAGFLPRIGYQFHWLNRGYGDFDGFLADLTARRRKAIRKERRAATEAGITLETLTGNALAEGHWDAFHRFYANTHDRKWGQAYLNRKFFSLLGERLGDRVVLILARSAAGEPVAGALNLRGPDALFGRYWGCLESHRFLHFEACYYRAIDFAIAHHLHRVEAGAQGPHKVQRGYRPVPTFSAHWVADPGFRAALERYLGRERPAVAEEMAGYAAEMPFRSTLAEADGSDSAVCG
ncbi:MAG: N-acetyltransferase [Rhodospirillales bacterium]|nr:MAG: N-acetyltransferase [Rhodospirillales bacterium]